MRWTTEIRFERNPAPSACRRSMDRRCSKTVQFPCRADPSGLDSPGRAEPAALDSMKRCKRETYLSFARDKCSRTVLFPLAKPCLRHAATRAPVITRLTEPKAKSPAITPGTNCAGPESSPRVSDVPASAASPQTYNTFYPQANQAQNNSCETE